MPFRKPVSTMGGLNFWKNIDQNEHFIMQQHKTGFWPYSYRILMRATSKEIANSNDHQTIREDWRYLEKNAVPRLDEQGFLELSKLENLDELILSLLKSKLG